MDITAQPRTFTIEMSEDELLLLREMAQDRRIADKDIPSATGRSIFVQELMDEIDEALTR